MGQPTVPMRFSGRDRELAEFRSMLDQARAGYGTTLHVTGEPGIGKTRLCQEFLAIARSAGFLVCSGSGAPVLSQVHLSAISALLRSATDQMTSSELVSVPAGLGPLSAAVAQDEWDQEHRYTEAAVADAAVEFFRRLSRHRPVVALVDRLEATDDRSLRLLAVFADRLADRGTILLVSGRKPARPEHRKLTAQITGSGKTIHLERLAEPAAEEIVSSTRPDLTATQMRAILKDAEGLPSYLSGLLHEAAGLQQGARPPESMKMQLEELFLALAEPARELATLLAVAPQATPDVVLLRLWQSDGNFASALRNLIGADLAVRNADGCFRLSHPAYGRIIRAGLFEHELRDLHRRFVAVLTAMAPLNPPALADHLLEISDEVEPGRLQAALAAAADFPGLHDADLCRYLEHLLALLTADTDSSTRYARYNQLGAAQQRLGRPDLATASWGHAMASSQGIRSLINQRSDSAEAQLAFAEWEIGTASKEGGKRYDPVRAAIHNLIWSAGHGTTEESLDAARAAIHLGEESGSADLPVTQIGYCAEAWIERRYADARRHALAARDAAVRSGERDVQNVAMISLSRIAPLCGDIVTSRTSVEDLLTEAVTSGLSYAECATRCWAALVHHIAGDIKAADEQVGLSSVIATTSGSTRVIARTSVLRALLAAERGDIGSARASVADAQRALGHAKGWDATLDGLLAVVRGILALKAGTPERVPIKDAPAHGSYPLLVLMLPFLSGLAGVEMGDGDRIRRSLDRLSVDMAQGAPVRAFGLRLRGLQAVKGGEIQAGRLLLGEAAATLDQAGFRLYSSQTRLEYAETERPENINPQAIQDLLQYFGDQGLGWWLQRTRRLARVLGLSVEHPHREKRLLSLREAEVVQLAAAGLSNAQISEQLFLSERTVESHMRNVYRRLELASRVALVSWAIENQAELSTGTDTAQNRRGRASLP